MLPQVSERADSYWVKETDEDLLVRSIEEKIERFQKSLEENRFLGAVMKNWRFYHGLFFRDKHDAFRSGLNFLGQEGEYIGVPDNEYRSLLQHLLMLVTENRPSFKSIATNSSHTSLEAARLGDDVLKYYFKDKKVEEKGEDACEHALIFLRGFVKVCWDPNLGKPIAADGEGFLYEGDVKVSTPSIFDVFYDLSHKTWEEVLSSWVVIREVVNRWDMLALYPEHEDAIKAAPSLADTLSQGMYQWDSLTRITKSDSPDLIYQYELYHAKSLAVPMGKRVKFIHGAALEQDILRYERIPLFSCAPAKMLLTTFGYSPAMDLLGLQEMLNIELGAIGTNHKSFGVQSVWSKAGGDVQVSQLKEGLTLVESEEEPKPLQLTATPVEILEFPDKIRQAMEYKSGINSVARGQPEASLKSGSALALIDSKAAQLAGSFKKSYYLMLEEVAHCILKTVSMYASEERIVSIIGERNRQYQLTFRGEDLEGIDRVQIESVGYVLQTPAGKLDAANNLLNAGILKTPQEYLTVLLTGNVEPLYMADHAQIALIHDENERLLRGENVEAAITDNHVLHVREHMAQLGSVELRQNQVVSGNITAHAYTHLQMVSSPEAMMWGAALGYQEMQQVAGLMAPPMPGDTNAQTGTKPGGSKPGDSGPPKEAASEGAVGETTPREPVEPGGSPSMPNMPGVPMVPQG